MEIQEAFEFFQNYNLWLVFIGLGLLATTFLPRLLSDYPLSMPIVLLILGYGPLPSPPRLETPDPREFGDIAEHLTELGAIISLMGAGLKIDRVPSFKGWSSTCRLLGIP